MLSRSVRVVPSSSLLSLQPMATMATPKMYLAVKGMPKKLPFQGFSWELNKALMAKDDTEMAAGAMFIQCRRGEDAFDMRSLQDVVDYQRLERDRDSDSDFPPCSDLGGEDIYYNDIVHEIIDWQLKDELESTTFKIQYAADAKAAKAARAAKATLDAKNAKKRAARAAKAKVAMKTMKAPKPMKAMKKAMKGMKTVAKSK